MTRGLWWRRAQEEKEERGGDFGEEDGLHEGVRKRKQRERERRTREERVLRKVRQKRGWRMKTEWYKKWGKKREVTE